MDHPRDAVAAPYDWLERASVSNGRSRDRELLNRSKDMDWKLELVIVPVSDVDRAKAFYTEKIGFNADHDQRVNDQLRFVQLTPPGSACSIAFGEGMTAAAPGSVQGLQMVVADVHAAREQLVARGVDCG